MSTGRKSQIGAFMLAASLFACAATPATTSHISSTAASDATQLSTGTSTPSTLRPPEPIQIGSVIDGDTFRALVDGVDERVRLIGINAPEQGECLAAEATQRLAELVDAGSVTLESDVSDRDQFDRLLRYVYTGEIFVNEALVREGLAVSRHYEPDTARQDVLDLAQEAAREDAVGLWDPTACGGDSVGAIEVVGVHPDADGDDNHNLTDEWIEIRNSGNTDVDLTGWTVRDESASHRYHFPEGFVLGPGTVVRLHTGCGANGPTRLYWCNEGSAVWNNSADSVFVLDRQGNLVAFDSYSN